jgi:hypothetical protein
MAKEIVTKGVSFNILDPDQEKMLHHALERPNFSGYIKRLIQRDMEGFRQTEAAEKQLIVKTESNDVGYDVSSFI